MLIRRLGRSDDKAFHEHIFQTLGSGFLSGMCLRRYHYILGPILVFFCELIFESYEQISFGIYGWKKDYG